MNRTDHRQFFIHYPPKSKVLEETNKLQYILATRSTDLFDGPQNSTFCRTPPSSSYVILLISLYRYISLIPVLVFPVPTKIISIWKQQSFIWHMFIYFVIMHIHIVNDYRQCLILTTNDITESIQWGNNFLFKIAIMYSCIGFCYDL